jgi:hypothetical protein
MDVLMTSFILHMRLPLIESHILLCAGMCIIWYIIILQVVNITLCYVVRLILFIILNYSSKVITILL